MVRESRAKLTNQRLQLEEVRWGGENVILGPPGRLSMLHAPITITSGLHNADTAQIFMRNPF